MRGSVKLAIGRPVEVVIKPAGKSVVIEFV